jgi:hypothetical protein
VLQSLTLIVGPEGVDALFDFDIDGDVGSDPNDMTLWFSQSANGLPSKVRLMCFTRQQLTVDEGILC